MTCGALADPLRYFQSIVPPRISGTIRYFDQNTECLSRANNVHSILFRLRFRVYNTMKYCRLTTKQLIVRCSQRCFFDPFFYSSFFAFFFPCAVRTKSRGRCRRFDHVCRFPRQKGAKSGDYRPSVVSVVSASIPDRMQEALVQYFKQG